MELDEELKVEGNLNRLYTEICNHVKLGQWTLARACVQVYTQNARKTADQSKLDRIKGLLLEVASKPTLCIGSATISSPLHLSLLSIILLEELELCEEDEIKSLRKEVNFKLLLLKCEKIGIDHVPYEECCEAFLKTQSGVDALESQLPLQVKKFVRAVLEKNASLACIIYNMIECKDNLKSKGANVILLWLIEQCRILRTKFNDKTNAAESKEQAKNLLQILATYVHHSDHLLISEVLCRELFDLCQEGILQIENVYIVLCCNEDAIKKFCELENVYCSRLLDEQSFESKEIFLRTVFKEDGSIDLRELYLRTVLNEKHFMEIIVNLLVEMVTVRNFTLVNRCLTNKLFAPLRPLILLMAWEEVKSPENACNVLNGLWPQNLDKDNLDPRLVKGCDVLYNETKVATWCIDQFRINPDAVRNVRSFIELCRLMRETSALNVLNKCFYLSKIKDEEIENILKHSCSKSDTFTQLNRDLMVFQSYKIMRTLIDVIVPEAKKKSAGGNMKSNDTEATRKHSRNIENELCQKFGYMDSLIKTLYPISYRVEILENLFTLLFATYDDIVGDATSDTEYGNEAADDSVANVTESTTGYERLLSCAEQSESLKSELSSKIGKEKRTNNLSKDIRGRFQRARSSDNTSSFCTCSSSSNGSECCSGFLCDDKIIHPLLNFVQENLVEAAIVVDSQRPSGPRTWTEFYCTEQFDDTQALRKIHQSVARLKQYVSEGLWKFEIVQVPQDKNIACDWNYLDYSHFDKKSTKADRQSILKEDEGNSEFPDSTEDHSTESELSEHQHIKSSHRLHHSCRMGRCQVINCNHKIINCMLSSPESLLNMCLLQNDFVKADQVIKTYSLQNSDGAAEVSFLKNYKDLVLQFKSNHDSISSQSHSLVPFVHDSSQGSLSNISQTAAVGLYTTLDSHVIENVLAHCSVPGIPELTSLQETGSPFANVVELRDCLDLRTITLADMLFSDCMSMEMCHNIASTALRRVTSRKLKPSKPSSISENAIVGFTPFLQRISSLSRTILHKQSESPHLFNSGALKKYSNLCEYLTCSIDPLDAPDYSLMMDNYNHLAETLNAFELALDEAGIKQVHKVPENLSPSLKSRLNLTFRNLVLAASEIVGQGNVESDKTNVDSKLVEEYPDYLKSLFVYLRQLVTLFNNCSEYTGLSSEITYLEVLGKDLTSTLGDLILQKNVSPQWVEKFTDKLDISLGQIIVKNICNSLPAEGFPRCIREPPVRSCNQKVLNEAGVWSSKARNPGVVAVELISWLIEMIIDIAPRKDTVLYSELIKVKSHSRWASWTKAVNELAAVDIKELISTDEALAFFVNVSNMLTVHSMIFQDIHLHRPKYSTSQRIADACIYAYSIGQLGILSLFELHCLMENRYPTSFGLPLEMLARLNRPFKPEIRLPQRNTAFLLNVGTFDSPKLQVVTANTVMDQLDQATHEYLTFHTRCDISNFRVFIPFLINDFEPSEESTTFFEKVYAYSSQEQQDTLRGLRISVSMDAVIFKFAECDDTSGIVFDYKGIKRSPCPEMNCVTEVTLQPIPSTVQEYLDSKYPLTSHVIQLLSGMTNPKEEFPALHRFMVQFSDVPAADILIPSIYAVHFWQKLDEFFINLDISGIFHNIQSSLKLRPELISTIWPLQDYILCNFAAGLYMGIADAQPGWSYANKIRNSRIRTNCVLAFYKRWPYEAALHMLQSCLFDDKVPDNTKEKLNVYVRRLYTYQQVLQWKEELDSWQGVAEESKKNPEAVAETLFNNHQYQLALNWAEFQKLSPALLYQIETNYLRSVLDKSDPDFLIAKNVLDHMESSETCIQCCEELFKDLKNIISKEYIVEYLLDTFEDDLSMEQTKMLTIQRMGIKIVKSLPSFEQVDYLDICTSPLLILEQMIMNMKIDYVTKYMGDIHSSTEENLMSMFDDIDALLKKYATEAVKVPIIIPYHKMEEPSFVPSQDFVIPSTVPTKEQWFADEEFSACMICKQDFTMLNRRHHCRRCGRVLCANCSKHKCKVEGYGDVKVRVCSDCNIHSAKASDVDPVSSDMERKDENAITPDSVTGPVPRTTSFSHSLKLDEANVWKLSVNEEHNKTAREEFTFEMVPNVHLCMSLLRLHREQHECAKFTLGLCNSLLSKLCPNVNGTPNREVDYDLIISMVEALLLTAKLKFSEMQLYDNISACDHIKTFLAVCRILIQNNCHHLLPKNMEAFTEFKKETRKWTDFNMKLMNSLLEEERWSLAVEVITKLPLENIHNQHLAVWRSWGLAALKAGEFDTAREKFGRALSQVSDRFKSKFTSSIVDDIIAVLEQRLYSVDDTVGSILQSLTTLKTIREHGVTGVMFPQLHGISVSRGIFEECMYYLDSYGTPTRTLFFLTKHKKLEKALQFAIVNKCSPETFINGIALPCLKMRMETTLEQCIRIVDPSLIHLKKHLFATCHYLDKKMEYESLLKFQDMLNDHAGASVTCIKMYHKNAITFASLQGNAELLRVARKHLERSLSKPSEPSSPTKVSWDGAGPKSYSLDKIHKQMSIMELQLEVNGFLAENKGDAVINSELMSHFSKESPPLTLFSSSGARVQLCALIIICGKTALDGYIICSQIIKEFDLNAPMVFGSCCRCLIKSERVGEIKQLIECILASGDFDLEVVDEIIANCICHLHQHPAESKEVPIVSLIKMMAGIEHKINAYILCKKLKSAYLLAVQDNRVSDVQRILTTADRLGQMAVKNICMQWLATRQN